MAEHVNPKLSILVDKSDGKKVYAATHSDGVVIEDGLWDKTDWGTLPGKLRLTKVLEEIPKVINNNIETNLQSLKLDITLNNGKSQLNLKHGDSSNIITSIQLPTGGLDIDTILVGSTSTDARNFTVNSLNTDYAIPTGRAVYVALDKTVGWVKNEIDKL